MPRTPSGIIRALVVVAALALVPFLPAWTPHRAGAAPPPAPPPHRLGARADTPAKLRGVPFHAVGAPAPGSTSGATGTLAAQVDLSAGVPPVGDQGWENSCVGWAVGYTYAGYQEWQEHQWALTDQSHQFSPAFVYNQIDGGVDNGSSPADAFNLLAAKGVASWASMPYTAGDYVTQPGAYQLQDALPYVVGSWAYFQPGDVAGMKAHIAGGDPVSLTIPVYPNFDSPTSPCTTPIGLPPAGTTSRGFHQITLVGYDDGLGAFKIVNQWGTSWGCNGYAWLSYDFVAQYGGYGYSMVAQPDTLGILTGRVTDAATGAAVAGAQVAAGGYAIATDAGGNYTLAVPAGSQAVTVSAAGYAGWSQMAQVAAGLVAPLSPALAAASGAPGKVTGRVTNAVGGAAVAGATVTAAGLATTTAGDGSYTLSLSAGSYTLTVSAATYLSAYPVVAVAAGATTTADVALQPAPGSLAGTVTSATSGKTLAGATVAVGQWTTQADANGNYRFASVPAGAYAVQASAANYQTYQGTVTIGQAAAVTDNLALQPLPTTPGSLIGTVANAASGTAVAGATVTLGSLSTQTDSYGNYTFSSVAPGTYTLQVSAAGYQTSQRTLTINPDTLNSVQVLLKPLPGTLTVQVVDATTGAPIKGAAVSVGTLSGKTNSSGIFSGSLPAGSYTLTVQAAKYKTATQTVTVTAGQTTTVTVKLSR